MIRKITSFYRDCLSRRPHYAIEIWKRSFVSIIRPYIHTNPSRKNWKTPAWRFGVGGKRFDNWDLENYEDTTIRIFPWPSFPQAQIQST